MTSVSLWTAREADVMICNALSSVSTSTTFYAQVDADGSDVAIHAWIKDLSVTGSKGEVELVNLIGEDTGGFQNQLLEEKPFELVEATGTAVFSGVAEDKGLSGLMGVDDSTAGTTITSGEKRFQFGSSSTNARVAKAVGIRLTDGTNVVSIGLNNAYCNVTDIKLTSDGHVECSFSIKCLGSDYYEDYNNS